LTAFSGAFPTPRSEASELLDLAALDCILLLGPRSYSFRLINLAHGSARTLSLSTQMQWLSGYRNLGRLLNDPETGQALYQQLVEVHWHAEACVKNPTLTCADYQAAIRNWKA